MDNEDLLGHLIGEPTKESFGYVGMDSEIKKMLEVIAGMKEKIVYKTIKNGALLRKLSSEVEELEHLFYTRFGVNVHLIGGENGSAFVIIPPHKDSNSVATSANEVYKDIIDWSESIDLSEIPKDSIFDKEGKSVINTAEDLDRNTLYRVAYTEMNQLREDYIDEKITIDYKNIKVKGLQSRFLIALDIVTFVNDYNLTARELLAVILHEVGHAITHSVSTNQRLISTFALMDTVLDFKTGNIKVGGHIKTKKDFINVIDSVNASAKTYAKETAVVFNSERTADLITTQVGLGESLSSALIKIGGAETFRRSDTVGVLITIIPLIIMAYLAILTGDVILILSLISTALTTFFVILSPSMHFHIPHGDGYERLKAIRSQMIKNVRKQSDTMLKEDLILQIKGIDKIELKLKELKADRTVINYISDVTFGLTDFIGMNDLNKRLTSIVENKLHVQKITLKDKLKTHKG